MQTRDGQLSQITTDLPAYSDTVYSDTQSYKLQTR